LNVLEKGHAIFPENKQILFRLIDVYSANNSYDAILNVIADAIRLEPENVELNYIAGYSYENANDIKRAKEYYNNVLRLDPNNYESNLALGLINLETLLKEPSNQDIQELTIEYLLKANEIKPYDVNALKALAKYYKLIDDASQLDRVNLLLNQLTVK
jgi:tetratricopeptide (TPR) repeat protein